MYGKFVIAAAIWLSSGLGINRVADVYQGCRTWSHARVSGCANRLSGRINSFLTASRLALTRYGSDDASTGTDADYLSGKWMVLAHPNPPEWMEQGILLP